MSVIGPGAQVQEETNIKPLLEGASEMEFVTVLNPLTDDFQVRVAQSIPVNMPFEIRDKTGMVQSERDVTSLYGLPLKNPDHQAQKYIYNDTIIPAGESKRFRGDMAQVAVRQLVNEIMQREKNNRMMADPTARREVELRIIKDRGYVQDIMENGLKSHQQVINETIDKSNEVEDEPFPGLTKEPTDDNQGTGDSGDNDSTSEKRAKVGRPRVKPSPAA